MNASKGTQLLLVTVREGEVINKHVTVESTYIDTESWNCDTIIDLGNDGIFICGDGAKTDDPHTYVNTPIKGVIEFLSDDEKQCLKTVDDYLHKKVINLKTQIEKLKENINNLDKVRNDIHTLRIMKNERKEN